tara:strand:+ start:5751 stop:6455 length:705 start_codon:yes stop_codon:yes gene_type:complete
MDKSTLWLLRGAAIAVIAVGATGVVTMFKVMDNSQSKTETKLDFLGKEPLQGWRVWEDRPENRIYYVDHQNVKKVKARGIYGRYIIYEYVQRYYQDAVAGTSGYSGTIGTATTNCYGYGASMSCTTTPAPQINIPGRSAVQAGVRQQRVNVVIDCLDRKAKWISLKGAPLGKKWLTIEGKPTTQPIADENCSIINSLPASNFMKWAEGKANKNDKLAQKVLPGSDPQQIRNLTR